MAPAVGFEPTTNRLTADRSTTELRWIFSLAVAGAYILPARPMAASVFFPHKKMLPGNSGRCGNPSYEDLVAGAGFEPAIPQARDYEPTRETPVIR